MTESDVSPKRETFFKLIFGRATGIVCIATLSKAKKFDEQFFRYPEELPDMLEAIERDSVGNNVYFCPQLLNRKARKKQFVIATPNAWADLDRCPPSSLLVEPTVVLESSHERYQAFWVFADEVEVDDAEDLSRRIAYKHADEGADRSGWDLTQLLRVPYTYNFKRASPEFVNVLSVRRAAFRLEDFKEYPDEYGYEKPDIPMPEPAWLQLHNAEELLEKKKMQISPRIWTLYNEEPPGDWSKALWNLEMLLFEVGYTRDEMFLICREAKCNKYERDQRSEHLLWRDVCRAYARGESNKVLLAGGKTKRREFNALTDEERDRIERAGETFVGRYEKWASGLGDAATQYHQAGGFICLSSLIAGNVGLPTSYGIVVPNMWFMILADTTLTRKTTAMDIAMDLIEDVDSDTILATDGSIEGLFTSLSTRPGKPSIFLRDEFSGLLEAMTKKDYMAGMAESLTKLYDGKMQKRILRKETITVKDPCLLVFAGGIKNKIMQLLTYEQVSSGFMPRFVFITAESDVNRVKPLGPPTGVTKAGKDLILDELYDIHKHYSSTISLDMATLGLSKGLNTEAQRMDAELTPEAWIRYNKLESDLLTEGLAGKEPDILTPVGDRLSKSILKASVLLAASRQRKGSVVVEEIDLLQAIRHGENWWRYALEVMTGIGKNSSDRMLDKLERHINKVPAGVSRSTLMQWHHLTARDATHYFETLVQQGRVIRRRVGTGEVYYPGDSQ